MTEKDGIIDLTDEVVETAPDDDTVIELTEVVSADETIIELSETVDTDVDSETAMAFATEAPAADEEAIDLVDVPGEEQVFDILDEVSKETDAEAPEEAAAWAAAPITEAETFADEIAPAFTASDATVSEAETEPVAPIVDAPTQPAAAESVAAGSSSESDLGDVVYFDDELEAGLEEEEKDDFVESLGMAIEDTVGDEADEEDFDSAATDAEVVNEAQETTFPGLTTEENAAAEIAVAQALAIPPEQLEAAIEKAVENAISGKIETILAQVVETAVTREIEKIKKALLEDMAD